MSSAVGVSLPRLSRSTTTTREILKYAVDGKVPGFTADFIDNYYSGHTSLSSAITHSRSGNAVMTDGYGPELVVNGGFDSDLSGYTLSNSGTGYGWIWKDGKAVIDDAGEYRNLQQSILEVGKSYVVTIQKTRGDLYVYYNSGLSSFQRANSSINGLVTFYLEAVDAAAFVLSSSVDATTIDSVSVREMPVLKWAPHNLLSYSEEFDNAAWGKTDSSVSSNAVVAPDGTQTADKLIEGTGLGAKYAVSSPVTVTASQPITASCFVKAGERTWFGLGFSNITNNPFAGGAFTARSAYFNLSTGTKGTVGSSLSSSSIVDIGNGWYLCTITGSPTATGTIKALTTIAIGDQNVSYAGDDTSGVYLWGAHLYRSDLGGMAGNPDQPPSRASYVPTTSSAVYLPRVGHHVYNGSAWVNEGLLAESEARTNLFTYSNDFTNAAWTKTNTATLALDSVGPDGQGASAVNLADSGATGTGAVQIQETVTITASTTNTFSVYAKKNGINFLGLRFNNYTTPSSAYSVFDLDGGVVASTNADHTALIQDVGNGWHRISITSTFSTDTSGEAVIRLFEDASTSVVDLDGTSSVLIYGAQFEEGSTPSSLIPTSGSSVTRSAESFTIPSANLPWPEPNYIGSQLVTNGTFDTDVSGWTGGPNDSSVSWNNGRIDVARLNSTTSGCFTGYQLVTGLTVGKTYWLQGDIITASAEASLLPGETLSSIGYSDSHIRFSNNTTSNGFNSFPITAKVAFEATATSMYIGLGARSNLTATATFDNISLREIASVPSVSIAMDGRVTFADTGNANEAELFDWDASASVRIRGILDTSSTNTGKIQVQSNDGTNNDFSASSATALAPNILVPYNVSSRHGSTFLQGALDGVEFTANTTPTSLPDVESSDLDLAETYMGTLATFRVWDRDLGDDGIVEATNPSLEPSLSLDFLGTGTTSFTVSDWSE